MKDIEAVLPLHRPGRGGPSTVATGFACFALVLAAGCGGPSRSPDGEPGHEGAGTAPGHEKGAHGGRLVSDRDLQAEVTIYERGVPPQFRVFFYSQGKPVPPEEITLSVELQRLGGRVDRIGFKTEQDYLAGEQVVEEPHSFDVAMLASRAGTEYRFNYSQTEGRVELSDEVVRASEIGIETAGPATMRTVLEFPGEIAINGERLAQVVPRLPGVIREIRKSQGDDVRQGEVLAVLDSRELADARREFLVASKDEEFARKAFEREEGLWQRKIASEADFLDHERALQQARLRTQSARQQLESLGVADESAGQLDGPGNSLTRYELRAPFSGVLVERSVVVGQAVKEYDELFTLADLSTVWVEIRVHAKDLDSVRAGQRVTVSSDAPSARAEGRIGFVGSLVGSESRTALARVVLPDPTRRWRPGTFVTVAVTLEAATVPVAVRLEALQKFRDWDVVFIRSGSHFEARPLELGRRDGDQVEVLSGLAAGERYASANSFILKADVGKAGASHDH